MSKNGKARRGMSLTTKAIVSGCAFLLALITVIICASTGLFVFKPGSVQANDKDAAAAALAIASQMPKKEKDEGAKGGHTVLISAGNGGNAYPSGSVRVADGSSLDIYFEANEGYTLKSISLDGKDVGSWSAYTLSNISGDHTIIATFKETEQEPKLQPTPEPKPQPTSEPEPEQTLEPAPEITDPPTDSGESESTARSHPLGIDLDEFESKMDEFFSVFGN